ncbi:TM2 domain-containing protein [Mycobacterium sp. CBMA293]|uniref:TM2 domain-containing protein n=2 Tax=unclassified Mycolicibacterium TaxID=2636767 RepID=UPI0012DD509F|nr:TM2 domain-containing protein [Mycolicibacterium sp. CBMA 360]MUL60460.1 TM2 domain-containing protein [Mycolicibacterium sp. CBMA 335]MUL72275.1 TM2 domain-containing protein [Mycolicibacterium sp. CBMA 311]MUL95324.1 TM2 domain-containing protein [Mycolicibacterium sp. CBMA 230]MUM06856.1 hypothetical protein [Mycolicibacterium sp. CBMA 213]MUM13965.1 TM2 domain-containing protein [Mycolicibacterium sp. CBMA 293]MUM34010.1 TM2 domain-containing protein [Mycolicibacterium sp. CBMA 361]
MSYPYQPGDGSGQQPGESPFGQGYPYGGDATPSVPPVPGPPPSMYPPPAQPGYPQQPPGYSQQPPGYPQQPPGYPPSGYGQPQYGLDPSAPFGYDPVTGLPLSDKSKVAAGLLQLFLGGFGIGRFYLGYTNIAVAQLCLTILGVLTSWLIIGLVPLMAVGIWALVDAIMIFTGSIKDPHGRPLRS